MYTIPVPFDALYPQLAPRLVMAKVKLGVSCRRTIVSGQMSLSLSHADHPLNRLVPQNKQTNKSTHLQEK